MAQHNSNDTHGRFHFATDGNAVFHSHCEGDDRAGCYVYLWTSEWRADKAEKAEQWLIDPDFAEQVGMGLIAAAAEARSKQQAMIRELREADVQRAARRDGLLGADSTEVVDA